MSVFDRVKVIMSDKRHVTVIFNSMLNIPQYTSVLVEKTICEEKNTNKQIFLERVKLLKEALLLSL